MKRSPSAKQSSQPKSKPNPDTEQIPPEKTGWRLTRLLLGFIALLAIPATLSLIVSILRWDGFFLIQKVTVSEFNPGNVPKWLQPLWLEEIQNSQKKWKGKDLVVLDFREVEKDLRSRPWVEDVRVSREWPNGLSIQMSFKDLVAYARDKKGRLIPLLGDGTRLPVEEFQAKQNLPMLTIELSLGDPQKIRTALKLFSEFPTEGSLTRDRVSEIGYDPKEGFWTIILPFGTRIKWGEDAVAAAGGAANEFAKKISRVRQVVDYLESRRIEARVIDANLSKKVVVRLRKTP